MRGSFTGAVSDAKGLFEQANGGTVFLDEIGETSAALQASQPDIMAPLEIPVA